MARRIGGGRPRHFGSGNAPILHRVQFYHNRSGAQAVKIAYFEDTDTLYIELRPGGYDWTLEC